MRTKKTYIPTFKLKEKALLWACKHFKYVYYFTNNGIKDGFKERLYASNTLLPFYKVNDLTIPFNKYYCGWVSYDLKNDIEQLASNNPDLFNWDRLGFIKADVLLEFKSSHLIIHSGKKPESILNNIVSTKLTPLPKQEHLTFEPSETKENYLTNINNLRDHIKEGDIYEACYCTELLAKDTLLASPVHTFFNLCSNSPKPFASFIKAKDKYLLGASPERFIKKTDQTISSQPIKGTIKRGETKEEDEILKQKLFLDPKERAENLMIVDLVRNDLARVSQSGSVKVDELFGIYTFPNVHQMISTISSKLKPGLSFKDIITATFPMGSMTGAPKIKAMELIEKYERFSRGIYSGTVGYFDDNGFDFNVTIRSLQYNSSKQLVGLHVGSAITYDSIPENEYQECLTKAASVKKALTD